MDLPSWAQAGDKNVVTVDTHEAYPGLFEEYRALYPEDCDAPDGWLAAPSHDEPLHTGPGAGNAAGEWADVLADLHSDTPSAYWCEVVYQTAKLDIVRLAGFGTLNRFKDKGQEYRHLDRPGPRSPKVAAGGRKGMMEARAHYRRLRGFLPV